MKREKEDSDRETRKGTKEAYEKEKGLVIDGDGERILTAWI